MISLLIQLGADLTALNDYDLTPADLGPKELVKDLGLGLLQTNINPTIRNKLTRGTFKDTGLILYDELPKKHKESLVKAK